MITSAFAPRIGIFGSEETAISTSRGCYLWPVGYGAALSEAGATPVSLALCRQRSVHEEILEDLDGILLVARETDEAWQPADADWLCRAARERRVPILGVDQGLQALNVVYGGSLYADVSRELPQALQHQHAYEPGDRHAINIEPNTRLASFYGEGEIVVNSEHRAAVCRLARGFRVSARALDGVIEAIEAEEEHWFALGVQWHPASASASGLDIQLFRGLVDACRERRLGSVGKPCLQAA
ncbi:MAG TPA: gamma-glutamyl-gamma-aminobutyrate hydrolase family protein [Gemmataceae bacterium]|nr:gamma-glutamyl-gamma-aminobutyrate hydrolase family protein [Gemmataceae bacterium]